VEIIAEQLRVEFAWHCFVYRYSIGELASLIHFVTKTFWGEAVAFLRILDFYGLLHLQDGHEVGKVGQLKKKFNKKATERSFIHPKEFRNDEGNRFVPLHTHDLRWRHGDQHASSVRSGNP
jgi:hypothetical protein